MPLDAASPCVERYLVPPPSLFPCQSHGTSPSLCLAAKRRACSGLRPTVRIEPAYEAPSQTRLCPRAIPPLVPRRNPAGLVRMKRGVATMAHPRCGRTIQGRRQTEPLVRLLLSLVRDAPRNGCAVNLGLGPGTEWAWPTPLLRLPLGGHSATRATLPGPVAPPAGTVPPPQPDQVSAPPPPRYMSFIGRPARSPPPPPYAAERTGAVRDFPRAEAARQMDRTRGEPLQ